MSTPAPELRWIPLGQLLVDGRILTEEQLRRALELKGTIDRRLGELVVELGFTTERAIAGALAEQYELEFVDLDTEEIFAAAVRQGMTTLRDDSMRLALAGASSVDEIRRVTGIRLI